MNDRWWVIGEDIHFRAYVKSRKTGEYINAHEICSWNPEYSIFRELVDGRNYNAFSLFGSRRGEYEELSHSNYGLPDFLKDTPFDEYCKECGYYGFIWFKLDDLRKAIFEYIERIQDPLKYLDPDLDEYADWVELVERFKKGETDTSAFLAKYREWLDMHRNILDNLKKMSDRLIEYTPEGQYYDLYNKIVDMPETVFLFFFDS